MAYKDLSAFIEALEAQGELVRVRREVSPVLEIAEIADRAVKGEGPALLFENVSGSTMPVAINLFASRRRMLAALQISSYEEWNERLEFFLDPKPPEGLLEKLKAIPKVTELTAIFPKTVRSAPCQEVVETGDSVDLAVPAEAEIVLEGYVEPGERRREGPFGDHTGFYSLDDDFPVFHVTAVTRRRKPVYLTTIVGKPPMEDGFLGEAVERLFLPLVRRMIPELVDMHLPVEGIFHNLMLVSIDKRYPGHARKTMHAIWGTGQMMFTKTIVVFDRDVDLRNSPEALWRTLTAIDPERDIEFVHGPVDELDFAARLPCYGSKMGIDATRKWKEEGFERRWPDEIVMSAEVKKRVDELWPSLGIKLCGKR